MRPHRLVVTALAVGVALSVAACGSSPSPAPSTTPVAAKVAPKPAAPKKTSAVIGKHEVTVVALKTKDLSNGYRVRLDPKGDVVTNQVTFDNCGYAFTTESHRVARHQSEVLNAKGQDTGLGNEVVAYDTPAQAKLALAQWRASLKRCHVGVAWRPHVAGTPPLTYHHMAHGAVSALPAADNDVASFSVTAKGSKQVVYLTAIYQRSGNVIDAIYYNSFAQPKSDEMTAVLTLATITGRRLIKS